MIVCHLQESKSNPETDNLPIMMSLYFLTLPKPVKHSSRLGSSGRTCSWCGSRSRSSVVLALEALRRLPDPPRLTRSNSHHMRVNCTGDAILHLRIQLREHVSVIDASLLDIPHGSLLHDVANQEPLHGLVLHHAFEHVAGGRRSQTAI